MKIDSIFLTSFIYFEENEIHNSWNKTSTIFLQKADGELIAK